MPRKLVDSEPKTQAAPPPPAAKGRRRGGRDLLAPVVEPEELQDPALDTADDDDDDAADPGPTPRSPDKLPFKLSPDQRRILIELIARYEYLHIVRDELELIDKNFPEVTDQTIRYYRKQIRAGRYPWLNQYLKDYAQQGIGNRDRRITLLDRQYRMLSRVPIAQAVQVVNNMTGQEETAYVLRLDVSKELREIAALAERMDAARQPGGGPIGDVGDNLADPLNSLELEEVRDDLSELVFAIRERTDEAEAAAAGAVRPARKTT